jgi:phage shock protein PspC (stress-responsive transcriptional regulator)
MTRNKKTLELDKDNAKWLGVCAGLANFLEVEPWTVRLVFLGSMFFGGWFLVPLYFVGWWLLDENSSDARNNLMNNQTVKHFRSVDYRKKLYRNTRDGKAWGVCAGIADYLEVSSFSVRLVFLLLVFLTGVPVLFYIGAIFVLEKRDPTDMDYERSSRTWEGEFQRETENATKRQATGSASTQTQESGQAGRARGTAGARSQQSSYQKASPRDHYSKRREFQYCARKFATLQQRLVRMEAYVTSSRFKLNREFRNMS